MKGPLCPQYFLHYNNMGKNVRQSQAYTYNLNVNCQVWPEFEQTCLRFYASWFPIISLWEILVAIETRVLVQSAP